MEHHEGHIPTLHIGATEIDDEGKITAPVHGLSWEETLVLLTSFWYDTNGGWPKQFRIPPGAYRLLSMKDKARPRIIFPLGEDEERAERQLGKLAMYFSSAKAEEALKDYRRRKLRKKYSPDDTVVETQNRVRDTLERQ